MMEEIKFSIIVPAFGVENYIAEALGNLMHQTYGNFEVIVVDDCSTDRTGEIAKRFTERDDRFEYVLHSKNCGVSVARNTGLERAKGDYVLFLDPDDCYDTRLLEVLGNTLKRNPVDVLVYGHTEDYRNSESGKVEYSKRIGIADIEWEEDVFTTNDPVIIHKLVMQMERATMLGYPWNKAYRRKLLSDNNLSFKEIRHIEDILFNCDVFDYVSSMTILSDVLYHYRNQGQTRLTGGKIDDYFKLQTMRVKRIYDQQQKWKTCDFEALGILAGEYFRSFQSNIVRMLENGFDDEVILKWCKDTAEDEMYLELKRYLEKDSKIVSLLYQPIAEGLFGTSLRRAKLMQFTKAHFPGFFNRAKQIR